jgi:hypothetical protein
VNAPACRRRGDGKVPSRSTDDLPERYFAFLQDDTD